ncbi:MAG: hypothetical protein C0490_02650 [Marivirga sp.]|nr:hypothetical protein [Marivirga sp.]
MKTKIYLLHFMLFFLVTEKLIAQSDLLIEIARNDPPAVVIKHNGNFVRAEGGELNVPDGKAVLKFRNNNTRDFVIVFRNTEEPFDSIFISDLKKTYSINNSVLEPGGFPVKQNFKVLIIQNGVEVLTHTLRYITQIPDKKIKAEEGHASGSAIYDAFYLKNGKSVVSKLKILAYYANVPPELSAVKAAYADNHFLEKEVNSLNPNLAQAKGLPGLSAAFSSLGGIDVTNLADGLAKFLVKRTKEELNIAFFQRFHEFISQEKYKDLQTVFPETFRTFEIIGTEIYNYERYIQTLRESFKNDLANLITNLPSIVENHPTFFQKNPELAATLLSSIYIAEGLRDKIHPGDILNEFPIAYLDSLHPEWKGALQTLQLFSASLRDSTRSDSSYWVSTQALKKTVKDTVVFRFYIGLTYQLAKSAYNGIPFNNTNSLVKLLDKVNPGKLQAYQNYIFKFVGKTDKLTAMIQAYSKPASDSIALEQYYNYFKSSIDLLEYATEISTLPFIAEALPDLKSSLKNYFDVANATADLALNINRKNYASAIRNVTYLYKEIKVNGSKQYEVTLRRNIDTMKQNIKTLGADGSKALPDKQPKLAETLNASQVELERLQEEKAASENVMDKLFQYGSFMSSIVMAGSSDEIAEAIEAFALPTGSARIKRETSFNVSLNAYVGPYVGREKIQGVEKDFQSTYGLSAPIGVSVSTGHSVFFIPGSQLRWQEGKGGWSTSLFISLIDIGALASFRFTENTISQTPDDTVKVNQIAKIELKNIISPGVFLSIGIPRCPLSINGGFQVSPNLRSVNITSGGSTTTNELSEKTCVRWSLSLVVDIPILNFYTKSRR